MIEKTTENSMPGMERYVRFESLVAMILDFFARFFNKNGGT
jgi:hypothetical protein